jgi:hypothetical protein
MSILSGLDQALRGAANNQRVDQILPNVYQDRSGKLGSQLLNKAAFAHPALGTIGNMGTLAVSGFGTWTLNAALSRTFRTTENQQLEFRAEAFNLPNAVIPSNPNTSYNSVTFGKVTSVTDPRIMQFALKYVF